MNSRRHRHPSPEELRQWHAVTQSVTPIGRPAAEPPAPPVEDKPEPPVSKSAPARPAVQGRPKEKPGRPEPIPLDRRLTGRVARGRVEIDGRLDLHGMTQMVAHGRLATFLHHAQAEGMRMVLVVTGKGREDMAWGEPERGVLRRMVPHWLDSAELRPFVVGFGEASRRHGGGGALYVHVRRRRG